MLPIECVAPTVEDAGVAFDHGVEAIQTASASLDFKQAMTSLHFVPEKALECNDSSQEVTIQRAQEKTGADQGLLRFYHPRSYHGRKGSNGSAY